MMTADRPVSVDEEADRGGEEERGGDPAPGECAQQLEARDGEAIADGGHGGEGGALRRQAAGITACTEYRDGIFSIHFKQQ